MVLVHRWAGLTIALFIIVAAVTGAVLPFEEELNFASRPDIARTVAPGPDAKPLDGVTIAERVEQQLGVAISYIPLDIAPDRPVRLFVSAKPSAPALPYDVVWADPYTGVAKLQYKWGGVSDGPENIVPFLYSLHYGYLFGTWGELAFGIAALIWALDCFVGFYLTLPQRPQREEERQSVKQWWKRWRSAWQIRGQGGHKLTFDLHRAGGLWLWPALSEPVSNPPITMREAVTRGTRQLRELGTREGFAVEKATGIYYDASTAAYSLYARTSLDRSDHLGARELS